MTTETAADGADLEYMRRALGDRLRELGIDPHPNVAELLRQALPLMQAKSPPWAARGLAHAADASSSGHVAAQVDAHVTSAAVLAVNRSGEVLLVEEPRGFGLPGGSCEPGELPGVAARRELEEETGLSADEWGCPFFEVGDRLTHVYYFVGADGRPRPGPGILSTGWYSAARVLALRDGGKLTELPSTPHLVAWAEGQVSR